MVTKIKKEKPIYIVYKIIHNKKVIYIGRTNNLIRREKEHNKAIKINKRKLYQYHRDNGLEEIKLIPIKEFNNKVESKRYEMLLILMDLFSLKLLQQNIPQIKDF